MSTNAGLYKRFLEELINHKNLTAIDRYVATDIIEHETLPEGIPPTHGGIKEVFGRLFQAFPDLSAIIEETIIESDKVVARQTWTGTHQGDFFGNAPSGKQVSFGVIDIVRIKNGKITEHWGEGSWLGVLQQIGAIPK